MVAFGISVKMINIIGKWINSNTYNGFVVIFISLFQEEILQTKILKSIKTQNF